MAKTKITEEWVTVTPKMAEEWYILSGGNRTIRKLHVLSLIEQMQTGKWEENGESIKFDEDARLVDGHHRLLACAEGKASFRTLVIRGIARGAYLTVDTGLARNGKDALAFSLGVQTPLTGEMAVTLSRLIEYENDILSTAAKGRKISNADIVLAYERYPGIEASITAVRKCKLIAYSRTAWLHYLVSRSHPDEAAEFFGRLADGVELPVHSPIAALRTRLINAQATHFMPTNEALAILVKAWNAFLNKVPVKSLRWQSSEGFPKIAGVNRKKVK
jgi:hypothetical protein